MYGNLHIFVVCSVKSFDTLHTCETITVKITLHHPSFPTPLAGLSHPICEGAQDPFLTPITALPSISHGWKQLVPAVAERSAAG